MKSKQTAIMSLLVGILFLFAGTGFCQDGKVSMPEWTKIIESKRAQKTPSNEVSETIPNKPFRSSGQGTPVTIYWHMADDADVYLNGRPLRNYEPSFKSRGDEAPMPAFKASAVIRNGDVFTVGGRRGGSYGFMLIAADSSGRIVFKTDPDAWRVYTPGNRTDWYQPDAAGFSPSAPVTVQPDP